MLANCGNHYTWPEAVIGIAIALSIAAVLVAIIVTNHRWGGVDDD